MTYPDLLGKLSVTQRDAVKSSCEEDLRAVLQDFHEALVQADKNDVFAAPVTDDVAPQYSSMISQPRDFGTMMDRLLKYKSFRDYFADVELVFSNAIAYNGWDGYIGGLVEDLQKYCFKFLLDAAGVDHQTLKVVATRKAARPDSWNSSTSESEEEEDEEDEDEDDPSSAESESDWDGPGRKRQLRRPARAVSTKKKVKRRY
ncbi:hypothetical protein BBO99_00003811 [Phytophthora kernoviae]|uniref:Bromo domain-containing protein n=2 Tax=Phytophthora kernoviae TaxID=325452 RepID=A0A3R7HY51_9STRA|nr:hypothetical protein G195_004259 [Phytophthora kernoviae 00238/432]KAG2527601.1 hypothetical protein JM16_003369 [Phytophthora kernoviae]KAG2528887.1 hypothetical protein JM18_003109 [Phytophthora kernoviae]RLN02885.1 hypothetical protein BBI17_003869 [Phytophthora kernoviae]RLN81308.1 hypothetical protein BBO99_00003811 [Phytophthora kernoviae]